MTMTNTEIPNRMDWQKVTHAYEAQPGNHRWRTCVLCGRGANAKIHDLREPAAPKHHPLCNGPADHGPNFHVAENAGAGPIRCDGVRWALIPELAARRECDGWWVTIRTSGQTRSPEAMVAYLEKLGYLHAVAADGVAAAIVSAATEAVDLELDRGLPAVGSDGAFKVEPRLDEFEVGLRTSDTESHRLTMTHLPCDGVVTTPAYHLTDLEALTRLAAAHRCPR